jgi:hypothetical protein
MYHQLSLNEMYNMKHRPDEHYQYQTSNLILGSAEVPFCKVNQVWVAIGGIYLYTLEEVTNYAKRLDTLITSNTIRLASSKQRP